jgi:hypothetical protein
MLLHNLIYSYFTLICKQVEGNRRHILWLMRSEEEKMLEREKEVLWMLCESEGVSRMLQSMHDSLP